MKWFRLSWSALLVLGCIQGVAAQSAVDSTSTNWLNRDQAYEQDLRYLAGPDTAITPAKVLRWVSSLMGHPMLSAPSNTEFQPIVEAHDTRVRILACIAYKF